MTHGSRTIPVEQASTNQRCAVRLQVASPERNSTNASAGTKSRPPGRVRAEQPNSTPAAPSNHVERVRKYNRKHHIAAPAHSANSDSERKTVEKYTCGR